MAPSLIPEKMGFSLTAQDRGLMNPVKEAALPGEMRTLI
jgi:hypothetical protein